MGSKQPQRPPFPPSYRPPVPPPPPPPQTEAAHVYLLPAIPVVWSAVNEDAEPEKIPAGELPPAIASEPAIGDFVIGKSKDRFTIVARGHIWTDEGPALALVVTKMEDE